MAEKPILFSAPMVRALLDGSKTQTRRVCKAARDVDGEEYRDSDGWPLYDASVDGAGDLRLVSPYGQPGERLWVREAHALANRYRNVWCTYRADGARAAVPAPAFVDVARPGWRPSIHMPRWASRITLEVTDVRVERLQDISEADAIAEGIVSQRGGGFGLPAGEHYHAVDPRESYWSLFESINGPGSAEANPWLWVVTFAKVAPAFPGIAGPVERMTSRAAREGELVPFPLAELIAEARSLAGDHPCISVGHNWVTEGGRRCPRATDDDDGCGASQAVYRCARCGVYDYGQHGGPGHADCSGVRTCSGWPVEAT